MRAATRRVVRDCRLHPHHGGLAVAVTERTGGDGVGASSSRKRGGLYLAWIHHRDGPIGTEEGPHGHNFARLSHRTEAEDGGTAGPPDRTTQFTACTFDKNGDRVFSVTACGKVLVFDLREAVERYADPSRPLRRAEVRAACVHRLAVPGAPSCRGLALGRTGATLLAHGADRALRLYTVSSAPAAPLRLAHTLADPVADAAWVHACFSGDGEYVAAGRSTTHDRYELCLWHVDDGSLADRLPGPRVGVTGLSWHLARSFLAASTSDGVDMWGPRMDWKAFAPAFRALEMNAVYIERRTSSTRSRTRTSRGKIGRAHV